MTQLEKIHTLCQLLAAEIEALCIPRTAKPEWGMLPKREKSREKNRAERAIKLLLLLRENPGAKFEQLISQEWARATLSRYLKRLRAAGYIEVDSRELTQAGVERLASLE